MIVGDSDPTLIHCYRHIKPQLPAHKIVFINRPANQCRDSLEAVLIEASIDPAPHMAVWQDAERMFSEIKMNNPDAMAFDKKVSQYKSEADHIAILPFNPNKWSS
jgi:hypothetical protein